MQKTRIPEATLSPSVRRSFSPARLDALKEVASIGAGHAATALSLMTGARIMIEVPMVNVGRLSELSPNIAPPDAPIVSIMMEMHGALNGQTLLGGRSGLGRGGMMGGGLGGLPGGRPGFGFGGAPVFPKKLNALPGRKVKASAT